MPDPGVVLRRAARDVRAEMVPDDRVDVFDIRARSAGPGRVVVTGETTVAGAAAAYRDRLAAAGLEADIRIAVLPDPALEPRTEALVRAPIAPVYRRPTFNATQITQYVLGARLTLLSRRRRFYRVRGEDAHVGWIHRGYLARGEPAWARAWEHGGEGQPVVSLGAEVHDPDDLTFARLPWGSRVLQVGAGRVLLPDGRAGRLGSGDVVPVDRLRDRFPPRRDSVVRTARRWLGAPYLWGGVTLHGVDCSGLVQSVFWVHGIAMPRDSDMQARVGEAVEVDPDYSNLHPGDLLFFSDGATIDHVAISTGGSGLIHASVGNGSVDLNDLAGDTAMDRFLRRILVTARRLLPD